MCLGDLHICIVTKPRDHKLVFLTRDLTIWLIAHPDNTESRKIHVYIDKQLQKSPRFDTQGLLQTLPLTKNYLHFWSKESLASESDHIDLAITLGGDGTVCYTSALFPRLAPPVLCFSEGSLGFLTPFYHEDHGTILNRVLQQKANVELRMRLSCTIARSTPSCLTVVKNLPPQESRVVLNEVAVQRNQLSSLTTLELYCDSSLITTFQADGLIVSTPTGSTAYSLSAGGPLVSPGLAAILITPICAHSLSCRPLVLPPTADLVVKVPAQCMEGLAVAFDGKIGDTLMPGDSLRITTSPFPLPTVAQTANENLDWIHTVRSKLRWNSRVLQRSYGSDQCEQWDITDSGYSSA